ncbi:MAG: SWF/SNF helicase family protein, partial [Myxococcales bacterium]|nr:SWF/SNF helicase family protein [Myxococcales bacterium]
LDKVTVGSPKLDELARILEAVCVDGGEKVVVFSQWETMTRMAEDVATGLGLTPVRLHGGLDTRQRRDAVDRFCQDPDAQVFISTDAGATGLNLQVASVFVNLDLPWNPALLEQRIGRVYRLGQNKAVHVYLLIAAGSYEERIGEIMRTKAQLFRAVIDEGEASDGETVVVQRSILDLATEAADDLLKGLLPKGPDEVALPDDAPPEDPGADLAPADAPPLEEPKAAPEQKKRRVAVDVDVTSGVLQRAVALAESTFGDRIDTLIARPRGLVLLMQEVTDSDIALADAISREVTIAVMERRTWAALERMGVAGADGDSPHALPAPALPPAPIEAPLRTLARKRLAAAEVVHREGMASTALELVAGALLAHVADIGGVAEAPSPQNAALWLYGDAVPKGWASPALAGDILKAQGLALAPAVPDALVV